jgi:hypothetical protein
MDDTVADAADARAAVTITKPVGHCTECGPSVVHRAVQRTIGDGLAGAVLRGEPRCRADALDLPARLEPPGIGGRPTDHGELQAR